jgi:hypothetical protein
MNLTRLSKHWAKAKGRSYTASKSGRYTPAKQWREHIGSVFQSKYKQNKNTIFHAARQQCGLLSSAMRPRTGVAAVVLSGTVQIHLLLQDAKTETGPKARTVLLQSLIGLLGRRRCWLRCRAELDVLRIALNRLQANAFDFGELIRAFEATVSLAICNDGLSFDFANAVQRFREFCGRCGVDINWLTGTQKGAESQGESSESRFCKHGGAPQFVVWFRCDVRRFSR